MSAAAFTHRRRNHARPSARDRRSAQRVVDSGGTPRDLVRLVLPHVGDDEADYLLWEQTAFPFVNGADLLPRLRALRTQTRTARRSTALRAR